nr:MAG TPA: hypothetical protein [Caudoviricetes sp.]
MVLIEVSSRLSLSHSLSGFLIFKINKAGRRV